jgi:chaperonin GroES
VTEVLRPLFHQVAIKEDETGDGELRESGLLIPATAESALPPRNGTVVAVGPGDDWWESANVVMPVKPGDRVVYPQRAGSYVQVGEEKLLVVCVHHLLGVLDDAPAPVNHGISSGDTRYG